MATDTNMGMSVVAAQHGFALALEPKRPRLPRHVLAQGLAVMASVPAWRFEVTEATTRIYWSACGGLRPHDFVHAVRDLIATSKWLPTPSEIRTRALHYAYKRRARRLDREAAERRAEAEREHERMERERQARLDALAIDRETWARQPAVSAREVVTRVLRILAAHRPDLYERLLPLLDLDHGVSGTPTRPTLTLLDASDGDTYTALRDTAFACGVRLEVYAARPAAA